MNMMLSGLTQELSETIIPLCPLRRQSLMGETPKTALPPLCGSFYHDFA